MTDYCCPRCGKITTFEVEGIPPPPLFEQLHRSLDTYLCTLYALEIGAGIGFASTLSAFRSKDTPAELLNRLSQAVRDEMTHANMVWEMIRIIGWRTRADLAAWAKRYKQENTDALTPYARITLNFDFETRFAATTAPRLIRNLYDVADLLPRNQGLAFRAAVDNFNAVVHEDEIEHIQICRDAIAIYAAWYPDQDPRAEIHARNPNWRRSLLGAIRSERSIEFLVHKIKELRHAG